LLAPNPASSQGIIDEAVTIEDLGFTQRLNVGARAAGMAGSCVASCDDVYALFYNPAGLAGVRRIDLSMGFQYESSEIKNLFYGNPNSTDYSTTTLDAVAAAYPLPVYRGSLVVAGGVYRIFSSEFDLLDRGFNETTDTSDDYRLQQSGSAYSYAVGFGIDLSPVVSVGMNAFILDGTIDALTQFQVDYPGPFQDGDLETFTLLDDAKVDLDGYGLAVGVVYHPEQRVRLGLAVTTPIAIDLQGTAVTEEAYYYFNAVDDFFEEGFRIDTEYTLPFRADFGLGLTLGHLIVNVDAAYTDWKQAEVGDVRLKDEDLQSIFRAVLDLRAGAEYLVPGTPLRVRAGYARTPYALEYLDSDRIDDVDELQGSDIETERHWLTAGAGVLLGSVLTLDASFEYGTGKRSIATLVDERTTRRVVLTGSYRF
jgi:long-subunit fatty acid transport protein